MKSLKFKLILAFLVMVIVSSLLAVTLGLNQGFQLTRNIIQEQFKDKLTGDGNMLQIYLNDNFGALSLNDTGKLIDKDGKPVDGRYDGIDKFSESMGVVSTVFSKQNDKFIRVLTTIKNDKGERVIGTELDSKGAAYKEISQGHEYLGQAAILGHDYITRYIPMYNASKQLIGIYFVGVPSASVNQILNNGISSTIRSVAYNHCRYTYSRGNRQYRDFKFHRQSDQENYQGSTADCRRRIRRQALRKVQGRGGSAC